MSEKILNSEKKFSISKKFSDILVRDQTVSPVYIWYYFSIPYIETSAATGENVQLAVNLLLHRVMQRLKRYMRDIRYNYEDEVSLIRDPRTASSTTGSPSWSHLKLKIQEIQLNKETSSCSLCSKTPSP